MPSRSFVIPILDYSPHSPYNIKTLLKDLENIPGEVICIFNSKETFEDLRHHPRINKYCYNKQNVGVSRSWNLGINLAEGESIFVLNADLRVGAQAIDQLENYLHTLERAVIVGPHGNLANTKTFQYNASYVKGNFSEPIKTNDVSGFFFAIHSKRFHRANMMFDVQFSPCLLEEWDIALQAAQAGLYCYVVPVHDFDHLRGISALPDSAEIHYFNHKVTKGQVFRENSEKFLKKWQL